MDNEKYFVRYRGVVSGPFTRDELLGKKRVGQLPVVASLSTDQKTWMLARSVEWLFPPPPLPAPKTPPPPPESPGLTGASRDENVSEEAGDYGPPRRGIGSFLAFGGAFVATLAVIGVAVFLIKPTLFRADPKPAPQAMAMDPARFDDDVGIVVTEIQIEVRSPNGPPQTIYQTIGHGTAFVVSDDGYLLTCRHVARSETIDGTPKITLKKDVPFQDAMLTPVQYRHHVRFGNGPWLDATCVFMASDRDVAVLKVDKHFTNPFEITADAPRGSRVMALGYPGVSGDFAGLLNEEASEATVAKAAYDQSRTGRSNLADEYPVNQYVLNQTAGDISAVIDSTVPARGGILLQTNTFIRGGNSGGPLIDSAGRVVGIVTLGGNLARNSAGEVVDVGLEGVNGAFELDEMVPMLLRKVPELKGRLSMAVPSAATPKN